MTTPRRSAPSRCFRLLTLILILVLNLGHASGFHRQQLLVAFASIPSDPNERTHEALGPGDVPIDIVTSPSSLPLWKLAVAGGLATMIGDAALHPMDCIKTIQQSDEGFALSLQDAARVILTTSGVSGFYRGLGAYVVTDGLGGTLKFGTYEKLTTWCRSNLTQGLILSVALLLCAAVAFLASSVILVPGEFVKQQLQMSHYDTLGAAVQGVLATDGVLGFYAGYDGVCLRDIPYTVLELGLYDAFKGVFHSSSTKRDKPLDVWQEICAAGAAGGITAYITTPLDTIKTKLMVDSYYDAGFWDCLITTIDQHGVGAIFAGALARIAWIVPFTALYLPLYEIFKRRLADTSTS